MRRHFTSSTRTWTPRPGAVSRSCPEGFDGSSPRLRTHGSSTIGDMTSPHGYSRPAVTVDCVVFGLDEANLKVLLIQRALEPYRGKWALPGGFVHMDEDLDQAAIRELREETGVDRVFLEQLRAFGAPGR